MVNSGITATVECRATGVGFVASYTLSLVERPVERSGKGNTYLRVVPDETFQSCTSSVADVVLRSLLGASDLRWGFGNWCSTMINPTPNLSQSLLLGRMLPVASLHLIVGNAAIYGKGASTVADPSLCQDTW